VLFQTETIQSSRTSENYMISDRTINPDPYIFMVAT
jgi:hypothetical protein